MATATLFTPIIPQFPRSVDQRRIADFLKERERYELEVEAKRVELPTLLLTPYKANIDHSLLWSDLLFGKLDRFAPNVLNVSELTDYAICSYIK